MSQLEKRWPSLQSIPRVSLGQFPTPVKRMDYVSQALGRNVWIKRDDLSGNRYGGNKVRKLEYLLGEAKEKNADTIITIGAVGSHHVLATTCYGRDQGFDVHAVLGPQPYSAHALESARCDLALGGEIHGVSSYALLPPRVLALRAALRLKGKHVHMIPVGGSSGVGALGYVEAGLELAEQISSRAMPEPQAVFVALGTGSTVAGLAVGLAASGIATKVIATRVTWPTISNMRALKKLIRESVALLRHHESRFPDVSELAISMIDIESREFGDGYGLATPTGEHAKSLAANDKIVLENTYTSKTLAALVRRAPSFSQDATLLYLHTLSSADLSPLLASAPPLPPSIAKLARPA